MVIAIITDTNPDKQKDHNLVGIELKQLRDSEKDFWPQKSPAKCCSGTGRCYNITLRERFIEEEKTDKCQFCPYTYLRTVKTDIFLFFSFSKN